MIGQDGAGADSGSLLALDLESMRRLGYQTVDMLVDRLAEPPGPVVQTATPEELRERLATPPPEGPSGFDEILARVASGACSMLAPPTTR
jgi:hypothetical protein